MPEKSLVETSLNKGIRPQTATVFASLVTATVYDHAGSMPPRTRRPPRPPQGDEHFMSIPLLTFFTPSAPMWFSPTFPPSHPHGQRLPAVCRRVSLAIFSRLWPPCVALTSMACCKCCCGGVDCAEGGQGKCCCGGASGTCCSASEYCCSGACQSTPCVDCATFDPSIPPCNVPCQETGCASDTQCLEGSYTGGGVDPSGECLAYYAACCPNCIFEFDEFGDPTTSYCSVLP